MTEMGKRPVAFPTDESAAVDIVQAILSHVRQPFLETDLEHILDEAGKAHAGMFLQLTRMNGRASRILFETMRDLCIARVIDRRGLSDWLASSQTLRETLGPASREKFTPAQRSLFKFLADKLTSKTHDRNRAVHAS